MNIFVINSKNYKEYIHRSMHMMFYTDSLQRLLKLLALCSGDVAGTQWFAEKGVPTLSTFIAVGAILLL